MRLLVGNTAVGIVLAILTLLPTHGTALPDTTHLFGCQHMVLQLEQFYNFFFEICFDCIIFMENLN